MISIVVPVYNAERYLEALIRSVLGQTNPDWELLLVDDGSTDDSAKICADFARLDSRIHALRRPANRRKGADACRNTGHEQARGEFMMYIDADDILAPYALEQRLQATRDCPEHDFWVFPAVTFRDRPMDWVVRVYGFRTGKNALGRLVSKCLPFVVWNNLYRKETLDRKGISWDEDLRSSQDADFNISCLLAGLKFREMDVAPDYFWRSTPSSSGKQAASAAHIESNLYYFDKTVARIEKEGDRNHDRDLRMLAIWIAEAVMKGGGKVGVKPLLSHPFIGRRKWFALRMHLFCSLHTGSVTVGSLLKGALFPLLEMRRRRLSRFFPWNPKKAIAILSARYDRRIRQCG